jgi:TnpA family transposase
MLKPVLDALDFRAASAAFQPLLEGIDIVRRFVATKHVLYPKGTAIPLALLTGNWASTVWENDTPDRRAIKHHFELCVLQKLERAIKCKEVWIEGAHRFRNPDEDMPKDWAQARETHYQKRGLSLDPNDFLRPLQAEMGLALEAFNRFLGGRNPDVTITYPGGGERGLFKVPKLDKQPERPIIQEAKAGVQRVWGMLDLLDILLEADRRVRFTRFFHTSGQRQVLDPEEVRLRLLLTIFSMGTNVGLKRIHAAAKPSCSYADLRYFRSRYLHADALREAIAALVNCILEARSPKIWGRGTACASDGKQLGAWDQNLMAEWNPHYNRRGIMVYWHVDTNALCIYSKLKTCSSSEVAAMIEGLVRHDTEMRVERNFVDSHGQSEVAFGFCRLLGVDLLPRLKRIKYERLYLPEKGMGGALPHLRGVLERPIRWDLAYEQYDEIVRHVVAVAEGTGPVDSILRRLNSYNRNHPTYRASLEIGKAQKTIFLCRHLTQPPQRREVQEGLNVVENWNGTVDFVRFGGKAEFQTNDPELQELSMLCLHLLQNAIVLSNTVMLERVLERDGLLARMEPEDYRALTPLFTAHINPYGEFDLDLAKPSFLDLHAPELVGVA